MFLTDKSVYRDKWHFCNSFCNAKFPPFKHYPTCIVYPVEHWHHWGRGIPLDNRRRPDPPDRLAGVWHCSWPAGDRSGWSDWLWLLGWPCTVLGDWESTCSSEAPTPEQQSCLTYWKTVNPFIPTNKHSEFSNWRNPYQIFIIFNYRWKIFNYHWKIFHFSSKS